jgi:hypothetical protein
VYKKRVMYIAINIMISATTKWILLTILKQMLWKNSLKWSGNVTNDKYIGKSIYLYEGHLSVMIER